MGIDNRNQHDMIRCMPGGVAGLRQVIADFNKRGVRVLFPDVMWIRARARRRSRGPKKSQS